MHFTARPMRKSQSLAVPSSDELASSDSDELNSRQFTVSLWPFRGGRATTEDDDDDDINAAIFASE